MALEYDLLLHAGTTRELRLEGTPQDATNPFILLQKVDGLDSPPLLEQAEPRAGQDGDILTGLHLGGRTLTLEGLLVADTTVGMRTLERQLRACLQPSPATWPLAVTGRGGDPAPLAAHVRVAQPFQSTDEGASNRRVIKEWTVGLRAASPYLTGLTEHAVMVTPPASMNGLTFPIAFPLQFFGQPTTGTTILNAGDAPAWPVIRIEGFTVNPRVTNVTTGQAIALDVTVQAGEWVEIDTLARTVLIGGALPGYRHVNRAVTSWWPLPPGHSQVAMTDADHNHLASATIRWRDTHL